MLLDLRQIFEISGERTEFDYTIPDEILKEYKTLDFIRPVKVAGTVFNRTGVVYLNLTASYGLRHVCDRCLCGFEREYSFDVSGIVVVSNDNDADEYIEAPGKKLDLDELVLSDLLLHFPSKVLCKEDCKGLCQICGADLNESDCDCQR